MAGPWEQYQQAAPAAAGPWSNYQSGGIPTGPRATGSLVDQIPGYDGAVPAATAPIQTQPRSLADKIRGGAEAAAALTTGAVTAVPVELAKIYGTLTSGKYGTQEGIRAGEKYGEEFAKNFYQPRTQAGQEYTADIANAMARTGLQGVPMNVLADFQRGLTPALQAGTDYARGAQAARATRIAQEASAKDWTRAPQIEAAQAARRLGVAINPAEANPNVTTKMLVSATGDALVNAKAAKANAPKWNELARQDLGLPENTPLTPEAFEKARSLHSKPYDAVRNLGTLQSSDDVVGQLGGLKLDPLSTSSPEKAAAVNAIVDRVVNQVSNGLTGENVVGQIRGFRKDATRTLQNPNASPIDISVAETNLGIANALENLIEANIKTPKALDEFRAARTALAKTYDWERATGTTTKQVDPAQIVKLAEKGKPLTGVLADVANVAGNFPDIANLTPAKEPLLYQRLRRGGAGGTVGFALGGGPVGAAIGAGLTSLGSEATANLLTRPSMQNRLAVPVDRRIPLPVEQPAPMVPIPPSRAVVPYDYSQQAFVPPNFVMVGEQYGPRVGPAPTPASVINGLPAPSAEGTINALRAEDARRAGMSRTLGREAEAQAAAAETAANMGKRTTNRAMNLEWDPVAQVYREAAPQGAGGVVGGVTPLESAVQKMSGQVLPETTGTIYTTTRVAPKTGAEPYTRITRKGGETSFERQGQAFAMTAEEKIAWNKAKADLAKVMPGMKSLPDEAIAAKMMDRDFAAQAVANARAKAEQLALQEAKLAEQLANRNNLRLMAREIEAKNKELARIQAERQSLMDLADQMDETLRAARPVSSGGQGPKTRAHQRNKLNMLSDQDVLNKLLEK